MLPKNIIIPINKDYNLSINHIGDNPEFAIICKASKTLLDLNNHDQVQQFTNFEELIHYVANELDYLNVPHRVMNKEYE
jgi:hypothetical protein